MTPQEWLRGPVPVYRGVLSQAGGLSTYQLSLNEFSFSQWLSAVFSSQVELKYSIYAKEQYLPAASALRAHSEQMPDRVSFVPCAWARGSLAFTSRCSLAPSALKSFSINSQPPAFAMYCLYFSVMASRKEKWSIDRARLCEILVLTEQLHWAHWFACLFWKSPSATNISPWW